MHIIFKKCEKETFITVRLSNYSFLLLNMLLKDQLALKMVLPEKLTCIAINSSGDFCAGGTSQGRIYIWEAS